MWYTVLVTLVVDVGGLLLVYALLRDRMRRATSAAAQIAELRDEVSRLVVELNQTTERNIGLMEDRIGSLNELLAAADRKIGLLHREMEKHDVGAQVYSRLTGGRGSGTAAQGSAGGVQGSGSAAKGGAQGSGVAAQGGQRAQPVPRGGRQPVAGEGTPVPPLSVELSDRASPSAAARGPSGDDATAGEGGGSRADLHQRVVMLSQSGFSAALIASRVGIPLGEVELIIALERQRMAQPAPGRDEEQA
ncbi:MAG: hypothetical protein ABSG17_05635 [Spirochaetia bacterium]|jgi:hypothetical protein